MTNLRSRKAFTVVELVIVIAVIAILAGVLIPTFSGIIDSAHESADLQVASAISKQLLAYDKPITSQAELEEAIVELYGGKAVLKSKYTDKDLWYDVAAKRVVYESFDNISGDPIAYSSEIYRPSSNGVAFLAGSSPNYLFDGFKDSVNYIEKSEYRAYILISDVSDDSAKKNGVASIMAILNSADLNEESYTKAIQALKDIINNNKAKQSDRNLAEAFLEKIKKTVIYSQYGAFTCGDSSDTENYKINYMAVATKATYIGRGTCHIDAESLDSVADAPTFEISTDSKDSNDKEVYTFVVPSTVTNIESSYIPKYKDVIIRV